MAITIRKTGAAEYGNFMKFLICGPSGSGKTLISSTAPNPMYASAEGGLMSIADRGIPYAEIRSTSDLLDFKNGVDQTPSVRAAKFGFPVDTVVVDTIDEIQHILIQERMKETKQDSLQLKDWGWLGEQMQAIIRGFRNIEANVVFLCHLKETSDGDTGRVWNKPGLQGAIADQIANFVDLSVLLRSHTTTVVEDGKAVQKTVRLLQTSPEPMYPWIKDRSGKLPGEIEVNFRDDLVRVQKMIFGETAAQTADPGVTPKVATPVVAPDSGGAAQAEYFPQEPTPVPSFEAADGVDVVPPPTVPASLPSASGNGSPKLSPSKPLATVETVKTETLTLPGDDMTCDECGGQIESNDVRDLSKIRYRRSLCKPCFQAMRAKK